MLGPFDMQEKIFVHFCANPPDPGQLPGATWKDSFSPPMPAPGNFWKSNKTRMIRNWGLSGEYMRPRNFLSEKPGSRTKWNVLTTVFRSWVELARTIGTRALILLLIKFLQWGWKGWKVRRLEGRPNIVAILKILVIPLRLVRPRAAMANGHSHCSSPQPLV